MDLSIKSKLLLTLGGLTILSVLTIALISINSIISTSNNAKTQSSLTLNAQIEEFLTNLITVSAEKTELKLNTVISLTIKIQKAIFNH